MSPWSKRRNKFRAKPVTSLCNYGFSHRSKLERALCDKIFENENLGLMKHIAHEVNVYLSEARVRYVADFKVDHVGLGVIYLEAKGFPSKRWPTIKKLWKVYGPSMLKIYGGSYWNLKVIEIIEPRVKEAA